MFEFWVVAGIVVAFTLMGLFYSAPISLMLSISLGLLFFGFLVAIPFAFLYHKALHFRMKQKEIPIQNWIWNPIHHQKQLTQEEFATVRPWFTLAIASFLILVVGIVGFSLLAIRLLVL